MLWEERVTIWVWFCSTWLILVRYLSENIQYVDTGSSKSVLLLVWLQKHVFRKESISRYWSIFDYSCIFKSIYEKWSKVTLKVFKKYWAFGIQIFCYDQICHNLIIRLTLPSRSYYNTTMISTLKSYHAICACLS